MRICFLAHADSIHTRRWVRHFRDAGHHVTVLSFTAAEAEDGVTTHVLGIHRSVHQERTNWHYLAGLPRLASEVRRARPDLVNAHFLASYGILGAVVRPRGVPYVISLHGSDVLVIPRSAVWKARAARWALRRADLVTSVAEHLTAVVRDELEYPGPVHTRQYGVDTAAFRPPGDAVARAPVVVSTRRLEPVSDPRTLIEAARIWRSQGLPLALRVVGDGGLRAAMEDEAADLTDSGVVRFVGARSADEVAGELRSAAIYVSTTLSDGASISLLEAMACGSFPVVSDIPANREWIRPGENGLLFPVGSAVDLAEQVGSAWNRPQLREHAAEENRRLVEERGDLHRNLGEIERRFVGLAGNNPPA
ncbi:MAG TPA: glycosyltransferase [bacterium]|nr:glycosyltransferase [bacterium]